MFQPLISEVISADEVDVQFYPDIGTVRAIVPFAQSEEESAIASIEARGHRSAFEDDHFYEFSFCITVTPYPDDSDEITELWTPQAAAPYIPPEIRSLILPIVSECYRAMARLIGRPIYRVCYGATAEVPHRNEVLTNALQNEGYTIEETGTDELGRTFWMMAPPPV
jgi:hypothetical protein